MKTKPRISLAIGFHLLSCAALLPSAAGASEPRQAEKQIKGQWVQIFNGVDLSGWTPKFKGYPLGENYKNTFRVENGLLKIDYSQYPRFNGEFGHLFWKHKLSDYRIRAEYRFVGEQLAGGPAWAFRNNGIMIFSQPPETMELDQDFPASVEVQMRGGGGANDQNNGAFCTPHTRVVHKDKLTTAHCNPAESKIYMGDDWVTIEVEVRGGKMIRHILDGKTVVSYGQPQLNPSSPYAQRLLAKGLPQMLDGGFIAIQAETHPTEFRKIEVLILD